MINNYFEPNILQMFKQQQTFWKPLLNVIGNAAEQQVEDPFMISPLSLSNSSSNQPRNQVHYFVVTNLADIHLFAKISDQDLYQQNSLGSGFTPAPGMFGNLFCSCIQNQHQATNHNHANAKGDIYACELRLSPNSSSSSFLLFSIQLAMGDDDLNPPVQVQLKVPLISCDDPRFVREWFLRPLLKQLHSVKNVAAVSFEQVCAAKSSSSNQNLGQFQQQVLDNLPNSMNVPNNNNNNNNNKSNKTAAAATSLAKNLVNQPVSLLISDHDIARRPTIQMLLDCKQTNQGPLFCINKICDAIDQELQNQERYHQEVKVIPIDGFQNQQHFSGESPTKHQQTNNNKNKKNNDDDDDDDDDAFFFAPPRGSYNNNINNNKNNNNNNTMMMMGGNTNKNQNDNDDDENHLDEKARRIVEEAAETEEARKKREVKEKREKFLEEQQKMARRNAKIKAQRRDRF